jgi:hypothetical protein
LQLKQPLLLLVWPLLSSRCFCDVRFPWAAAAADCGVSACIAGSLTVLVDVDADAELSSAR